ncbi:MAG: FMN-binding protein [Acidaminobacteraceae bacterium]
MLKSNVFNNIKLYIQKNMFIKKNHKKIILLCALIITTLLGTLIISYSSKYSKHIYMAGEYVGIASGYNSNIEVKVVTDDYRILQIDITHHKEMPVISEVVFKNIPYRVIRENSTDVDIVSGATYTSEGLIRALDNAISKARIPKLEEN